jgi:hypothetical protein
MDESCERQLLRWKLGLPDDYFFKQCEAGEEASARHTFLLKPYPQLLSCMWLRKCTNTVIGRIICSMLRGNSLALLGEEIDGRSVALARS